MTVYVVSSGVTSSGVTLDALDTMTVLAGGATVSITDGGHETVSSGGLASATTVVGGGVLALSSGAVASGATVSSGGVISGPGLLVGAFYDFGTIAGAKVGSNAGYYYGAYPAQIYVESGGLISGVYEDGNDIEVMSGGVAKATVLNYTVYNYTGNYQTALMEVDFGGEASGTIIEVGEENLLSGGESFGTTVSGGGYEVVQSGAVASGANVLSGGVEVVSSGGEALGGAIGSGGTLDVTPVVSSGMTLILSSVLDGPYAGVQVQSGATVNVDGATVSSGGAISGAWVLEGAVYDYGSIDGATVGSNAGYYYGGLPGQLYVESGGLISGVTEDGDYIEVMSGGVATATVLNYASNAQTAHMRVDSGGVASGTIVEVGYADVYGESYGATVGSGGEENVQSGGESYGTTVSSGSYEEVQSAGMASGATVLSGGMEIVGSGGEALGGIISSGATLYITPVVSSGMSLILSPVLDGPYAGVQVQRGATINVEGATVSSGGSISGAWVLGGAIYDYGSIDGATVGSNVGDFYGGLPGLLYVESGGLISRVSEDGYYIEVMSRGVAKATVLNFTGSSYAGNYRTAHMQVDSGGVASGTIVELGYEDVYGETDGTTVSSGGFEYVESGAVASGATVLSGGVEVVSSGGEALGGVIGSGGTLDITPVVSSGVALILSAVLEGPYAGLRIESGAIDNIEGATVSSGGRSPERGCSRIRSTTMERSPGRRWEAAVPTPRLGSSTSSPAA